MTEQGKKEVYPFSSNHSHNFDFLPDGIVFSFMGILQFIEITDRIPSEEQFKVSLCNPMLKGISIVIPSTQKFEVSRSPPSNSLKSAIILVLS